MTPIASAALVLWLGVLPGSEARAGEDGCGDQVEEGSIEEVVGFERPESAVFEPDSGDVFVSNIGLTVPGTDAVSAVDGNGSISIVGPDGAPIQWITGLNSPKGLRLHGGTLYAADIDRMLEIDTATGSVSAIPVPVLSFNGVRGALNDPEVHGRYAYVSDFRALTVWRIDLVGHAPPEVLVGQAALMPFGQPNGIVAQGNSLFIGTGPAPAVPALSYGGSTGGYIVEVDLKTGTVVAAHGGGLLGRIDGLEILDGKFLYTHNDQTGGIAGKAPSRLVLFDPRSGAVTTLLSSDTRSNRNGIPHYTRFADIGIDRQNCGIAIPHLDSPSEAEPPSSPHFVTFLRLTTED